MMIMISNGKGGGGRHAQGSPSIRYLLCYYCCRLLCLGFGYCVVVPQIALFMDPE